ncbi:MAG TPA: hypothetical protein VIY49_18710 [Bryobacteraceae bacterium]
MIENVAQVEQHLREFGSARARGDVLVQELLQLDLGQLNHWTVAKPSTD